MRMGALAVQTGHDVAVVGVDAHDLRCGKAHHVLRELFVVSRRVVREEPREAELADVLHQNRVQHAVVHPRLRHRRGAAAVVASVAHGDEGEVVLDPLLVQPDRPMPSDAAEDAIRRHADQIAAAPAQVRIGAELMHALGNARVDARAGDRQAVTPAAVDEVERLRLAVPEIFRIEKLFVVRAEVFEKIVARADGDAGHRGVGIARDAVGDLIDRAVAAAGIEPHLFSALGKTARERGRVADRRGEHTLYVQTVFFPQRLRHRVDALAAVVLTGRRIDDKNVFQGTGPPFR